MEIIIKKESKENYTLIVKKENSYFNYYSARYSNVEFLIQIAEYLIKKGIISKKGKSIHFINFIKEITINSKLKIKDRKVKQFSKRYNDLTSNTFKENYIERKVISDNFLSIYKKTKDLFTYFQYLYYCNKFNDFSKPIYAIENIDDDNLLSMFKNSITLNYY
jgi:hypothetical protein